MTRTYVEVQDTANKCSKVLKTLFPTQSLDLLARVSRDELVELLAREPAQCGDDLEPVSPGEELKGTGPDQKKIATSKPNISFVLVTEHQSPES